MSFDRKPALGPGFLNPAEQARVILEVCHDDIHDARAIAATNLDFARTEEDILFWLQVEQALLSKPGQPLMSAPRPDKRAQE